MKPPALIARAVCLPDWCERLRRQRRKAEHRSEDPQASGVDRRRRRRVSIIRRQKRAEIGRADEDPAADALNRKPSASDAGRAPPRYRRRVGGGGAGHRSDRGRDCQHRDKRFACVRYVLRAHAHDLSEVLSICPTDFLVEATGNEKARAGCEEGGASRGSDAGKAGTIPTPTARINRSPPGPAPAPLRGWSRGGYRACRGSG